MKRLFATRDDAAAAGLQLRGEQWNSASWARAKAGRVAVDVPAPSPSLLGISIASAVDMRCRAVPRCLLWRPTAVLQLCGGAHCQLTLNHPHTP